MTRELESARKKVSREERQALAEAETLRIEAEELLNDARAEAARIVEQSRREADEAAHMRRQVVGMLVVLRDAMERADLSLQSFLESAR